MWNPQLDEVAVNRLRHLEAVVGERLVERNAPLLQPLEQFILWAIKTRLAEVGAKWVRALPLVAWPTVEDGGIAILHQIADAVPLVQMYLRTWIEVAVGSHRRDESAVVASSEVALEHCGPIHRSSIEFGDG